MTTSFQVSAIQNNTITPQMNQAPISQELCQANSNPFSSQVNANPFTLSASSIKATEFVPSVPQVIPFVPINIDQESEAEDSAAEIEAPVKRFKTELCKNWIENAHCRYGTKC